MADSRTLPARHGPGRDHHLTSTEPGTTSGQAEDLVQDTYLRALRSLRTYRGDCSGHRWLLSIDRRVCADAIQATDRARRPKLTRRRHIDHTDRIELLSIIDDLIDEHRQALVLTQVLGYSYDEATAICECPVGTIRSRVARARLADALAQAAEHAG